MWSFGSKERHLFQMISQSENIAREFSLKRLLYGTIAYIQTFDYLWFSVYKILCHQLSHVYLNFKWIHNLGLWKIEGLQFIHKHVQSTKNHLVHLKKDCLYVEPNNSFKGHPYTKGMQYYCLKLNTVNYTKNLIYFLTHIFNKILL